MGRLGLIVAAIELVLLVIALVDLVLIDPARVRALPKWVWAVVIIVLAIVGPLLWFFIGRERLERRPAAAVAPDDDPDFLRRLRERLDDRDEKPE